MFINSSLSSHTLPRFASKIKLISKAQRDAMLPPSFEMNETYLEFNNNPEYASPHFSMHCFDGWRAGPSMEDGVHLRKRGYTRYAYDCGIGAVKNNVLGSLGHQHSMWNYDNTFHLAIMNNRVREDVKKLAADGSLSAIITGGYDFSGRDSKGRWHPKKHSNLTRQRLQEAFAKAGIQNCSLVWGRNNSENCGPTSLYFDQSLGDTWFLCLERNGGKPEILTTEDLKNSMSRIQIAEGDVLEGASPEDRLVGPFKVERLGWLDKMMRRFRVSKL